MKVGRRHLIAGLLALSSLGPGYGASASGILRPSLGAPAENGMRSALQSPREAAAVTVCEAPLTLTLRSGLHFDNVVDRPVAPLQVPPDAPPDPVFLQLPLYPGATPTTQQLGNPEFSYEADAYLKTGTAAFLLPINAATAEDWYKQAFAACGYAVIGGGSGGAAGTSVWFRSTSDPHIMPWVVFIDNPAGGSFVLYVGEEIALPPRPRDSYLPIDVVRVQLRYLPRTSPDAPVSAVEQFTIRQRATIHQLVTTINSLTDVLSPGWIGCAWYGPKTFAWIKLVRRSGKVVKVQVKPDCFYLVVGHARPIVDTGSQVWKTVVQMAADCQQKRC